MKKSAILFNSWTKCKHKRYFWNVENWKNLKTLLLLSSKKKQITLLVADFLATLSLCDLIDGLAILCLQKSYQLLQDVKLQMDRVDTVHFLQLQHHLQKRQAKAAREEL